MALDPAGLACVRRMRETREGLFRVLDRALRRETAIDVHPSVVSRVALRLADEGGIDELRECLALTVARLRGSRPPPRMRELLARCDAALRRFR